MTNEPPVPPFQAIANILAKKTALGKDMRYKQLDLTAKAKDAAETGLAILMEIVTSNKLQPTLSDDVYTALAWKMAAYAAMTKPINDINFRDNMARAGAYPTCWSSELKQGIASYSRTDTAHGPIPDTGTASATATGIYSTSATRNA